MVAKVIIATLNLLVKIAELVYDFLTFYELRRARMKRGDSPMWNWFLANGDKALNSLAVLLMAFPKTATTWAPAVAALASLVHQLFAPEATPGTPPVTVSTPK